MQSPDAESDVRVSPDGRWFAYRSQGSSNDDVYVRPFSLEGDRGAGGAKWLVAKNARRPISITTDMIVGFPGETEEDFEQTLELLDDVEYDSIFSFKFSPRPNTAAATMADAVPEEEKTRRLMILQEKQRAIQIRRNTALVGTEQEVLVEGRHEALQQWIGRTSQNRVVNFTGPGPEDAPEGAANEKLLGEYRRVRITRAGPNSLVGEMVANFAAA